MCIVMPGLGLLMSSSGLGRAQPSQSGETADRALWLLLITTTSSLLSPLSSLLHSVLLLLRCQARLVLQDRQDGRRLCGDW